MVKKEAIKWNLVNLSSEYDGVVFELVTDLIGFQKTEESRDVRQKPIFSPVIAKMFSGSLKRVLNLI